MSVAVPTAATVVTAHVTQIDAIATPVALDNVFGYEQRFRATWEDLKAFQDLAAGPTLGDLQVVYVIKESEDPLEGRASGEKYAIFNIVSRLFFIRAIAKATWKAEGDAVATSIVDKLDGNAAIFAIASQRQVAGTPETAGIRQQGFTDINDEHGNSHRLYTAEIVTRVEARRWT